MIFLPLDELTVVFIVGVHAEFEVPDGLVSVNSLHGTPKGKITFKEVKIRT